MHACMCMCVCALCMRLCVYEHVRGHFVNFMSKILGPYITLGQSSWESCYKMNE